MNREATRLGVDKKYFGFKNQKNNNPLFCPFYINVVFTKGYAIHLILQITLCLVIWTWKRLSIGLIWTDPYFLALAW